MSKCVHILVSGKVQGVGFRNFVQAHAEALELCGWARNLRDGRVEILVAADAEALKNFRSQLEQGPRRSHVEEIIEKEVQTTFVDENFKVIEDGGEPWSQN